MSSHKVALRAAAVQPGMAEMAPEPVRVDIHAALAAAAGNHLVVGRFNPRTQRSCPGPKTDRCRPPTWSPTQSATPQPGREWRTATNETCVDGSNHSYRCSVRAAIALWCAEHRARNVQFWFMLQMAYLIRRGRVRDPIQRPAHTVDIPVRLPDDILLTLTICPAWPGSGRRRPAGRFCRSAKMRSSSGLTRTHQLACSTCRSRVTLRVPIGDQHHGEGNEWTLVSTSGSLW